MAAQFGASRRDIRPKVLAVDKALPALLLSLAYGLAQAQAAAEPMATDTARALVMQAAQSLKLNGARVEVTVGAPDPRLRLAPCKRTEPYLPAGARALGRTRVGLRCVEGSSLWNITLPVTVSLFAPAAVLREALPAGARLTAAHFAVAEVDWAATPTLPLADPEQLVGRELARPIAAGAALQPSDLRQRQWFAAGETVQIVARGAGFSVSTDGEALSHGIEGQPVRVRTASGRLLSGRAVADRQVEVLL